MQRLADKLLDEPVEGWIKCQRAEGNSWRRISLNLRDATDGDIDVAPSTLLAWVDEPILGLPAKAAS